MQRWQREKGNKLKLFGRVQLTAVKGESECRHDNPEEPIISRSVKLLCSIIDEPKVSVVKIMLQ